MSISEIKTIIDMASTGFDRLRGYQDPVRKQANRFLEAFEAHQIARQQIVRVLPADLPIPHTAFSTADKLQEHLSPALLNWAAEYLALNRLWLDGVGEIPHKCVMGYKNEAVYSDWLEKRIRLDPTAQRRLLVWASCDPNTTRRPTGYLSIVYVEDHVGFDENELSRYWSLTDQWPMDHRPCIDSMLKVIRIGRSHEIPTVGRILDHDVLHKYERGYLFAPQANSRGRSIWYPEDLIDSVIDAQ